MKKIESVGQKFNNRNPRYELVIHGQTRIGSKTEVGSKPVGKCYARMYARTHAQTDGHFENITLQRPMGWMVDA